MYKSKNFEPDFNNMVDAAYNKAAKRLPIYDHIVDTKVMEVILNKRFADLINGSRQEKIKYFINYCSFFKNMGYDTVIFEGTYRWMLPKVSPVYFF